MSLILIWSHTGHVKFSLSCLLHSNRHQEGRYAETLSQCLRSQHQRQQYPDKFWKAATGTNFDFFFQIWKSRSSKAALLWWCCQLFIKLSINVSKLNSACSILQNCKLLNFTVCFSPAVVYWIWQKTYLLAQKPEMRNRWAFVHFWCSRNRKSYHRSPLCRQNMMSRPGRCDIDQKINQCEPTVRKFYIYLMTITQTKDEFPEIGYCLRLVDPSYICN